ncbi:MAG TPA: hypothetical protein VMY76_14555 [Gemmatimonadales bacterium]|nr:hypothetical protein [Gemmatimonadales bacterium]
MATLVGLVLLVDAVFIAIYYAAGLRSIADGRGLAFTVVWMAATLAVVFRGLRRIRAVRTRLRRSRAR